MKLQEVRKWLEDRRPLEELELRVTFYARVSTGKDEQLNSLSSQIAYYSNLIQNNQHWTYVDGYIDEGKSGKSTKGRTAFLNMIEDAKQGEFDLIITKEISRFSRDTVDSLKATRALLDYGVGVKFESDNIMTFEPDSELRLTIMSSIAQEELRKISGRVKRGFRAAIEQKHSVLGNNNIWGYNKKKIVSPDGTSRAVLEINEEEAQIVRRIFDLYASEQWGIRKICEVLNAEGLRNSHDNNFSFSTIRGILSNPKYKGFYCGHKTSKEDYRSDKIDYLPESEWVTFRDKTGEIVPAIVSVELWDRANLILGVRREKMISDNPTSYQNKYAYSGKIVCGEHGTRYQRACYHYKSGDKEVWQCKLYYEKGKKGCENPLVYTTELDQIVKTAYQLLVKNQESIIDDLIEFYAHAEDIPDRRKKMQLLEVEIKKCRKRIDRIQNLYLDGDIPKEEYVRRRVEFDLNLTELERQGTELEDSAMKALNLKQQRGEFREVIGKELDFKDGMPAGIVDSILDRVEVYKTDDPKTVKLKVYFRISGDKEQEYTLSRKKGEVTSVCSSSSI